MEDYIKAKLYPLDGKMFYPDGRRIKWYVYYFVRNPYTEEMEMKTRKQGINKIKDRRKRMARCNRLIKNINELLCEGRLNHFQSKEHGLTLIQRIEKELELMRARCINGTMRKRSYDSYKCGANLFTAWLKKNNMEFSDVKHFGSKQAHAFCEYMIKEKKYTGVTFNARKSYIGMFFNIFIDKEIISINPFRRVKPLPEIPIRNTPFTKRQMAEIDKHMIKNCYRLWVFTRFIYYCFLRPMEITLINISDINTKKWFITIYGDTAKTKTQGVVWVPKKLQEIIKGMKLEKYSANDYLFGKGLFPGPVHISRNRVTYLFQTLVKIPLNIPEQYTMYAFKHTGNVRAVELKIGMEAQRIQNRHSTQAQTMVYLRSIGQVPNKEFMNKMK